jgi:hypothetical protein
MRGDAAASPEAIWRKALQARGREWVVAELKRRPGQPRDPLLEVVFEEPHPSREYCQKWCAEEENRFHIFSWSTVAAAALLVIVIICAMHAVSSRNEQTTAQAIQASAAARTAASPAPLARSAPLTNDIPTAGDSGASSTATSAPRTATSVPTVCAYQSYPTAACPATK